MRAIAKANNLDISTVQGSGKSGRVMKEDILRVLGGKVNKAKDERVCSCEGLCVQVRTRPAPAGAW